MPNMGVDGISNKNVAICRRNQKDSSRLSKVITKNHLRGTYKQSARDDIFPLGVYIKSVNTPQPQLSITKYSVKFFTLGNQSKWN